MNSTGTSSGVLAGFADKLTPLVRKEEIAMNNIKWTNVDVMASTRDGDEIYLVFTDKDDNEYVFGLKKTNARWIKTALKRAVKLRKAR